MTGLGVPKSGGYGNASVNFVHLARLGGGGVCYSHLCTYLASDKGGNEEQSKSITNCRTLYPVVKP